MSDPREDVAEELPKAKVRRRQRMFPVVWVVPLIAALVAGYLVYDRVREFGPKITVRFKDGTGLRTGQTPIKYRGVPIGEVTAVELSEDREQVLVTARLQRSAASIAREGAIFWIVRPEVGFGSITGLRTVITGPEIQVLPGNGEAKSEFLGLDRAPIAAEPEGLKIVLRTDRPRSLKPNSPVYYRGVEVGVVQTVDLGPNAATADVHALIRQRYAVLVRSGSVFWNGERGKRERRPVQRPADQDGILALDGGRRDRIRHPGSERPASEQRDGVHAARRPAQGMAAMGAPDPDPAGEMSAVFGQVCCTQLVPRP